MRVRFSLAGIVLVTSFLVAQDPSGKPSDTKPANPDAPPQESSSRDTRVDVTPPQDDAKNHPNSEAAVSDLTPKPHADAAAVQEHPFNPMKSKKDIDIGDFYFRRKNYKGALERYKDALFYKDNDAVATYRVAVCEEKLGDRDEAQKFYEQYLKILPDGPLAKEAKASLDRLSKAR